MPWDDYILAHQSPYTNGLNHKPGWLDDKWGVFYPDKQVWRVKRAKRNIAALASVVDDGHMALGEDQLQTKLEEISCSMNKKHLTNNLHPAQYKSMFY